MKFMERYINMKKNKCFPRLFIVDGWSTMKYGLSCVKNLFPTVIFKPIGLSQNLNHVCLAFESGFKPTKKEVKKLLKKVGIKIKTPYFESSKLDLYKVELPKIELIVCARNEDDVKNVAPQFLEWRIKERISDGECKIIKIKEKKELSKKQLKDWACDLRNVFGYDGDFKNIGEFLEYKKEQEDAKKKE